MKPALVAILRLSRLNILPGGILAYSLGAAMGAAHAGSFRWDLAAIGLLVTVITNLTAHYADEYADIDTDTLTRRTFFSGGSGVLPSGLVPPAWALRLAVGFAVLSIALTALLTGLGILPLHTAWIIGVGLFLGWFYSMPPLAFERVGLGELVNAFLGGIMMPLMGYTVQTGAPSLRALVALLPIFFFVLMGLLPVHWADRQADAAVGRRTLAMLAGERVTQLHRLFLGLGYGLTLAFYGWVIPLSVMLSIAATAPLGVWAAYSLRRGSSPAPSSLTMAVVILAAALGWIIAA